MTRINTLALVCMGLMSASAASADTFPLTLSATGSFSSAPLTFAGATPTVTGGTESDLRNIALGLIVFPEFESETSGAFLLRAAFTFADTSVALDYSAPYSVIPNRNGPNDTLLIDFPEDPLLIDPGMGGDDLLWFWISDVSFVRTGNRTRDFDLLGNLATSERMRASVSPVPEPSSVALLSSIIAGVLLFRFSRDN